jgi:hypothetical protein
MVPAGLRIGINRNQSVNWTSVTLIEIMSRLHCAGKLKAICGCKHDD